MFTNKAKAAFNCYNHQKVEVPLAVIVPLSVFLQMSFGAILHTC